MQPSTPQFLAAIAKIEQLSPAPRILGRALALLRAPESELADIVVLIHQDPALTADIIRGANSVFYGLGERVASLDRAVQKIGFRESIRLLNLSVIHLLSARSLRSYGMNADASWTECLLHGIFMENLARTTRAHEPDEAYTAGLLRYIGRQAINQILHDLNSPARWDGAAALEAWEIEHAGFSQAHAGALLLQAWKFTESMCVAIEWQNQPAAAPAPSWLAAALQFTAAVLPTGAAPGLLHASPPCAIPPSGRDFATHHQLTPERLEEILAATRETFAGTRRGLY